MSKVKAHYYTDWDREMATKKPSSRKKDKTYPGHLKFQLDDDLLKIVEEKGVESPTTTACTPEVSRAYWESFKLFLDASGVFTRTWNLYSQIKKDPDINELNEQMNEPGISLERLKQLQEIKEGVVRREVVMRSRMHCDDLAQVYDKAHSDWNGYKYRFKVLLEKAEKADVAVHLNDKERREWMLKFILINDSRQAVKRRSYYKDHFVKPALEKIKETGYSEPYSLVYIEEAYEAWRKKNVERRRKNE